MLILTYETLMVGHPCSRAGSAPTAHIWQVALSTEMRPAGPALPARCLYPQLNDQGKNRTLESRNDPSVHKCLFSLDERGTHPKVCVSPLLNIFMNYSCQDLSEYIHELFQNLSP